MTSAEQGFECCSPACWSSWAGTSALLLHGGSFQGSGLLIFSHSKRLHIQRELQAKCRRWGEDVWGGNISKFALGWRHSSVYGTVKGGSTVLSPNCEPILCPCLWKLIYLLSSHLRCDSGDVSVWYHDETQVEARSLGATRPVENVL